MFLKKLYLVIGLLILMVVGIVTADNTQILAGGDVFIGEQGLNITALSGSTTVNWFAPGNDILTSAPAASRTINPASVYISPADYGGYTGNWYVQGSTTVAFVVRDPSLTLTVRDNTGSDVTGKSVTQGTNLSFRIESNTYSAATRPGTTPFGVIKVQTPDGTIYTQLAQGLPLTQVNISSSLVVVGPWDTGATSGGSRLYKAGTYTVWIELNNTLNQIHDNYNVVGKTSSTHVTIAISSGNLQITSNVDTVTLGNQFSTTITGIPNTQYHLFVKSVGTDNAPQIVANQEGAIVDPSGYSATVTLTSSGTRTIGWTTNQSTKDKGWTIRVEESSGTNPKSDELTITVSKGSVTIAAPGSSAFYLGNEIKFTGTNTQSDITYFFITGPNLPSSGGQLNNPRQPVTTADPGTFASTNVNDDNTWSYKWQTGQLSIDAGSYTIYAMAAPKTHDSLGDTQYATASITLSKPYITASAQGNLAAGDKLTITGNAGAQNSAGIAVWFMGKNLFRYYTTSVNNDGSFSFDIPSGDTQNLAPGQYYVVIQNPMYNNAFDVYPNSDRTLVLGTYPVAGNTLFSISGPNALQGSDAANALVQALKNPAVDDTYTQISTVVAQPFVTIQNPGQKMVGDAFILSGSTNLAANDNLLVNIVSSSFSPTDKTQSGQFSGYGGTVKVVSGTGLNTWSFNVDTTTFKPDEYLITVSGVETSTSTQTTFNVVPFVPTTIPTPPPPPPTTAPTTAPTTPTAQTQPPTPAPTTSPGFGSLVACGGLCVVGYLVSRKTT